MVVPIFGRRIPYTSENLIAVHRNPSAAAYAIIARMSASNHGHTWPDPLSAPDSNDVQKLLTSFWHQLRRLSALLSDVRRQAGIAASTTVSDENLLAIECVAGLRTIVIDMMLALNGIARPPQTINLNVYLSENQRSALERTLLAPEIGAETWIGQAVSLVVIYRWYAPQLVERYQFAYPADLEAEVWATLRRRIYDWPANISTD
jgi:hypothetical protein